MNSVKLLAIVTTSAILAVGCSKPDAQNATQGVAQESKAPAPEAVQSVSSSDVSTDIALAKTESAQAATGCALDTIDGKKADESPALQAGKHSLRGWITNENAKGDIVAFQTVLSGKESYIFSVTPNNVRPDVAEFLKAPNLKNAGFNVDVDLSNVKPGEYQVVFYFDGMGGQGRYKCDTSRKISING